MGTVQFKKRGVTGATSGNAYSPVEVSGKNPLPVTAGGTDYEFVGASNSATVLGVTGCVGDYLSHVTVIPTNNIPGNVIVTDGSTAMTVFAGAAQAAGEVKPFTVEVGARSVNGPWKLSTGANVTAIGVGDFTQ